MWVGGSYIVFWVFPQISILSAYLHLDFVYILGGEEEEGTGLLACASSGGEGGAATWPSATGPFAAPPTPLPAGRGLTVRST